MKKLLTVLGTLLVFVSSHAEVLEVIGIKTETLYEGKTYEHVYIQGSKYITLRNCTIKGATQNYAAAIRVDGSSYITIENCDINGNAKACNGVNNHGSARLLVKNCRIYNCNDDGIEHHSGTLSDYVGNRIYNLRSCGTDNGCSSCNNGHSDGIELRRGTRINLIGNLLYGSMNTSCLFLGQVDPVTSDVVLHNNIMYGSTCGYTAYIWYCHRLRAYNNVFWHAKYGAIWWGVNLTDAQFRNNILGGKWSFRSVSYNRNEHHVDNNLFTIDFSHGNNNIRSSNPQFAGTPSNTSLNPTAFKLKSSSPCINKGMDDPGVPTTDHFGYERKGLPDIGVHEYGSTVGIDQGDPAGITNSELADVLTLQVYPLPMTGVGYFSMARLEVTEPVLVTVFDQTGKTLRQLKSVPNSVIVSWDGKDKDGSQLKAGVYYYAVSAGPHYFTGRIVKTR